MAVTFGLAGMLAHYDLAAPGKLAIFTLSMALTGQFLLLAMMAAA